jgi:uncharacterized protein (TIGR02246 family)
MNGHRIGTAFLLLVFITTAAFAQNADRPLNAAERQQLGVILPHLLDMLYVSPEKGTKLAEQLRAWFASGRYDQATTASQLADLINADLAVANDRHLSLRYTGNESAAPVLTIDAWNAMRTSMQPRPRPATRDLGILRVEILDGNVGYLKMREFVNSDEARAALSNAMALLAKTDAMIVDVRNCPGGNADTVSYLASYFFEPGRRVLMNRYNRPTNRSMESTTVDVPGPHLPNVDLYILTGRSASACESFAFTLQQWGRAKTVGEKTAGAGNNNMLVDVGAGLTFSISIGTAIHPKTNKGWEAIGVLPDIAVPADRALEAAHAEALRVLGRVSAPVANDAISEVRALERAWLDAYEKRDAAAMNRIVADDFSIAYGDGSTQSKADVIAALERAAGQPAPKFTTEDVRARAYGDTVILTGRVITERARPDGTSSRRAARYTDTYVRRNGQWQVASSHLGSNTDAPAPVIAAAAHGLDDYVGTYGVRQISMRDGALYYQRVGGHGGVLKPLKGEQFDLNGDVVITFNRGSDGAVQSMRIDWKDGKSETVPRD